MHTLAHIAFYFAAIGSALCIAFALVLGLYASYKKATVDSGIVYTSMGMFRIEKDEMDIQIVWEFPAVFAFVGLLWAVGALALHAVK